MEITLKIVGQADDAQIEAMRAKIEEMGPALKKALDSGGFAAAAKAAEQFSQAQMLAAKAALEEAKATLQAQKAATELASAQKFAERAGYELAAAQRITAREASAVAAGLRQTGEAAREAGGAGVPSLGGLIDKIKGIHPATAGALAGIGLLAVGVTQLGGAVSSFLSSGVSLNAQFETFETQLGTLMGSTDAAKERIAELSAFAASTPFELPQLIGLEKLLVGFGLTGSAVQQKFGVDMSALRTSIGDMAAGTGVDIVELGNTWGKFASGATGEAISRLQELGIVTREQLAGVGIEFSKSGELTSPLPVALDAALKLANEKFGGGMAALSSTFEGQMSTLGDNWNEIKRVISEPIFDVAKEGLAALNGVLSDPTLQAAVSAIAVAIGDHLRGALETAKGAVSSFAEGGGLDSLKSAAMTAAAGFVLLGDGVRAAGSFVSEHSEAFKAIAIIIGTTLVGAAIGLAVALLSTLGPALVATATAALAAAAPVLAMIAPFVLVGAAVGALAVLIYSNWDGIKAATADLYAQVSAWWNQTRADVTAAVAELWASVQAAWAAGVAYVQSATDSLAAFLSGAWESIKTTVSGAAGALWTWLRNAWSTGVAFLVQLKIKLATSLANAWNWVVTTVSSVVARLINWIKEAWHTGMSWLVSLMSRVSSSLGDAWAWVANTVGGIVARLVNAVSAAFHAGARFIGQVQDKISEVFQKGWSAAVGVFRSAASSIIGGVRSLFTGIAKLAGEGMTAAGSIVDSILSKIIGRIGSFISSLGLGSAMEGVMSKLRGASGSILGSIGDGIDGIISRIGSGIGDITSFFKDKIDGARTKVADLFNSGPLKLATSGKETGGGGPGGGDLGGLGGGVSGISGGAAGGPKDIMNVGDSGRDSQGDYYIDENGAKIYTSGAGLAKQQAKERAREAREAERAARASKSASTRASARREASEGSVAREMADTAKKVSEAVQAGLDAIAELRGAEIPGEAVWRPRLDAIMAFVAAAADAFQKVGKGLLTQIGVTEEGTAKLDDAASQQAQAAADLGGSMMDTVTKTAGFLQGLVKAKWPTEAAIAASLALIGSTLGAVQAQAQELAAKIAPKTETTDPAGHLAAAGQAVSGWVDAYMKIASEAERLAKVPPVPEEALATVQTIMGRVSGMMGGLLVGPGYNLLEDTETSKDHLAVADAMAGTIQAGVDTVIRVAEAARELTRVPPLDDAALATVETIMRRVSQMTGALVVGPGYDLLADNERSSRDLSTAREMLATVAAGVDVVDRIVAGARNLSRAKDVPESALTAVQTVMRRVSEMIGALVVGPGYNLFADAEKSLADLSVARAMVDVIGSGVALVDQTAGLGDRLARAKPIPQAAVEVVYATWRRVSEILGGLLIGPGYNLLADTERTVRDLSVARALVDLLSVAVGVVTQTAVMGDTLAKAKPIPPGAVEIAIGNASLAERLVREAAVAWRAAIEAGGGWMEDAMATTKNYADHVKGAIGLALEAGKLKLEKILPLDPAMLETALANAALVERRVRAWSDQWHNIMEVAGLWADEVAAKTKTYVEHVKGAVGLVQAIGTLSLKDVLPLDPGMLELALENAALAERRVRAFGDAWAAAMDAADRELADVAAQTKAYADHIKEVAGVVGAAAGLALADIVPLDEYQLGVALSNLRISETFVRRWSDGWHRTIAAAGREVESVLAETRAFAEQVKAVADVIMAGVGLVFQDVRALSIIDIERVLANVTLVLDRVSAEAGKWASAIRAGGRKLEDVVADGDAYHKMVAGAADMIVKASDAFRALVERPPPRAMSSVMTLLREQITMMMLDLAAVYDVMEQEKGRLKKVADLAPVLSAAAEGVGAALDTLSLDKLLASPLVDTKLRSGFMQRAANNRMAALGKQISEGVKRTVQALVDGLSGVTVPAALPNLDPMIEAYERVVALLERIHALQTPTPSKVAEVVNAIRELTAAMGTVPGAGAGPATRPGAGGSPRAPGGGGGGNTEPLPGPVDGMRMDATINVSSPVYLDTEQIGAAIERTLMARNLAIVVTPQGG